MTLNTSFIIDEPTNALDVFDLARSIIGANETHTWRHLPEPVYYRLNPVFCNDAGQGLPALLYVEYGADGPLLGYHYDEDDNETIGPHDPAGFIEVSFDTAYGYKDELGRGCGALHAMYVGVIGRWCESNGWKYHWQNEFTGEWFDDWRKAADELGRDGDAAEEWFTNAVAPILGTLGAR